MTAQRPVETSLYANLQKSSKKPKVIQTFCWRLFYWWLRTGFMCKIPKLSNCVLNGRIFHQMSQESLASPCPSVSLTLKKLSVRSLSLLVSPSFHCSTVNVLSQLRENVRRKLPESVVRVIGSSIMRIFGHTLHSSSRRFWWQTKWQLFLIYCIHLILHHATFSYSPEWKSRTKDFMQLRTSKWNHKCTKQTCENEIPENVFHCLIPKPIVLDFVIIWVLTPQVATFLSC